MYAPRYGGDLSSDVEEDCAPLAPEGVSGHMPNRIINKGIHNQHISNFHEKAPGKQNQGRCDSFFDSGVDSFSSTDLEKIAQQQAESEGQSELHSQIRQIERLAISDTYYSPTDSTVSESLKLDSQIQKPVEQKEKSDFASNEILDEGFSDEESDITDNRCEVVQNQHLQIFEQDSDGDTQLHVAIIHRETEIIRQMIELAPSAECMCIQNDLKQSPLHLAVHTNQPQVTRWLLISGANAEDRDRHGQTALHIACANGLEAIVEELTRPVTQKEISCIKHSVPFQRIPQDMNILNYEGYTCFHLAGIGGHLNIVRHILQLGGDINSQDGKSGRTLLHQAVESNNEQLVWLLLQHPGIHVDRCTYSGSTALDLADERRNSNIITMLLQHGANPSAPSFRESSDSGESDEESDIDYDDFQIAGQPIQSN